MFLVVNSLVVVAGLALAVYAGRPAEKELDYADAGREIGGALVAGGLVAGLVVWFEETRENERILRDETRDELAAERAWRRDVDLRLFRLVFDEVDDQRFDWRLDLERDTERIYLGTEGKYSHVYMNLSAVSTLLDLLQDKALKEEWGRYLIAHAQHEKPIAPAPEAPQAGVALWNPPRRDQVGHSASSDHEERAWRRFQNAVTIYRERNYS